jgi:FkbM family methyltransferase
MIPKIIHFTVPREMTTAQSEAIRIARATHPDWQIKVWQDPVDPAGFTLAPLWVNVNSGAQLADLIRLDVVNRCGGVYLDSDVRVLKRLDPIAEHCDFFVSSEDGIRATNAVFGAVPQHPAVAYMIKELLEFPPNWKFPPNCTTGPDFFTRSLKWRTDITVLPRAVFYPYNWDEAATTGHPHTYAVHTWAGSWQAQWEGTGIKRALRKLHPRRVVRQTIDRYRTFKRSGWGIRLLAPVLYGYGASDVLVRQTVYGHSILLNGADVSITPQLYRYGYYKLREELFLQRALKGGDVFIDVGANVGAFSLLAAKKVGSFGRAYAYEPNPAVAGLLRRSATMNWMHERLIVRAVAVGEKQGEAELVIPASRLGDAALDSNKVGGASIERTLQYIGEPGGERGVMVKVVSLDDEFPYDIPIRVLKLDAEGHETQVLAGANRLLRAGCIDFIMLEALEEVAGPSWRDFLITIAKIARFGYDPFVFGLNGRLKPTTLDQVRIGSGGATRNIVLKRVGAEV